MQNLEIIAERIRESFDARTAARDRALSRARTLTRHSAKAIRAVHRNERSIAQQHLMEGKALAEALREDLRDYPDIYYAGYSQDALKEYTEANMVYALVDDAALPTPEQLSVEYNTYLKGLAETVGELRRRCLDILRHGYSEEVERLLGYMDDIYGVLVTIDYPDAITGGLRRLTDIVRSLNERTRGDVTFSLREQHLEQSLRNLENRLRDVSGSVFRVDEGG